MTPAEVEGFFRRGNDYVFARWGRPVVPVVFGVADETLEVVRGAWEAVLALAGHPLADTDPELGANAMMFFLRDWGELRHVPDLDRLIPNLATLLDRLEEAGANQYRAFRFDETGAIKACFIFLRLDQELARMQAGDLALAQVVQAVLLWSDAAFADRSPLVVAGDRAVLRPEIANLIRAAYDPVMPQATSAHTHAMRLAARMGQPPV